MTAHPLKALHALCRDDGRLRTELLENEKAGVVRLSVAAHDLWVLLAREEGSIWDRWSDDSDLRFVRFTDDEVAAGPDAMLARLAAEAHAARAADEKEP